MINKEQIAHDLTIVYLKNRYGINVSGNLSISGDIGSGEIHTDKLPSPSEIKYKKVGTGEKGFLGLEKKDSIEDGYKSDTVINELVQEYYQVYGRILKIIEDKVQKGGFQ